ncbi:VOC family protein [Jatrophihabitans fulvus]
MTGTTTRRAGAVTGVPDSEPSRHGELHSEHGAELGDPADRAGNPVIKVVDLAWLEFTKPDLDAAERFAHDFGFATAARTADALYLRGTLAGGVCAVVRRGPRSAFLGPTLLAADRDDVARLAAAHAVPTTRLDDPCGGVAVELHDPSGMPVRVVAGVTSYPELERQRPLATNTPDALVRINATQRPPREPARIERLGHVVVESASFDRDLDFYLHNFGLIVSDFLFYAGQRDRGPTMAFIRCDRGDTPSDHHTLAMNLGPGRRYIHSAYQVAGLDAMAAGQAYLAEQRYTHAWGIGRHIEGSQLFDYWRDPDGFMVEHFADGDMFDSSIEAGWSPMTASGLSQWGPKVTAEFLGTKPSLTSVRQVVSALKDRSNEFDARRLLGLLKVAAS